MEVTRHQLGSGANAEFRARQLRARDMLRGDLEGEELEQYVQERVLTTTLDKAVSWARGWTSPASASRPSAPRHARPTC